MTPDPTADPEPGITTTTDLRLWLDGYDAGAATAWHTLADLVRAGASPGGIVAVIEHMATAGPTRGRC